MANKLSNFLNQDNNIKWIVRHDVSGNIFQLSIRGISNILRVSCIVSLDFFFLLFNFYLRTMSGKLMKKYFLETHLKRDEKKKIIRKLVLKL